MVNLSINVSACSVTHHLFINLLIHVLACLPGVGFELSVKSAFKADSFGFSLLYCVFGYN